MKTNTLNLVLVLSLLGAISARGQGTVNFNNLAASACGTGLNAPVYGPEPLNPTLSKTGNTFSGLPAGTQTYSGPLLNGSGYWAQLYGALGSGRLEADLVAANPTTTFRTGGYAGYVAAVTDTIPGTSAGGTATVQLRAWDNTSGFYPTWASAEPAWNAGQIAAGKAPLINVSPLGGAPPYLCGLASFNLYYRPLPPSVSTLTALGVTGTSATLRGMVNPHRLDTTAWFNWGTNSNYGSNTVPQALSPGTDYVSVSNVLAGLTPAQLYHFRVVATNSAGTNYGNDTVFTTLRTNASLSWLALSAGTLSPAFNTGTIGYTAVVSSAITSVTVTPTVADATATIQVRINGGTFASVASGNPSNPLALNAGNNPVDVRVTAQDGTTVVTYTITVVLDLTLPVITTQPANQGVLVGQDATFSVGATGLAPLRYQWRFNGSPLGGATNSSCVIANAQLSNAGPYNVIVTNSSGSVTSASASLTVTAPPGVVTLPADPVTSTNATLNGTVNPGQAATTAWFEWGATASYGNATAQTNVGSGGSDVAVSALITNLSPFTTLHCRLVATNSAGTSYGADAVFTTPAPPSASTLAALGITATSATLRGMVNPHALDTTVWFNWGTDTSYGSNTASQALSAGTTSASISNVLAGLTPNELYHFRVAAANGAGTNYGSDAMFATLNNNASLSGLTLSNGTLSPPFNTGTTGYTAAVLHTVTSITVTPTAAAADATIQVRINGGTFAPVVSGSASSPLALNTGDNPVDVRVTAQDGATVLTYTIRVRLDQTAPAITSCATNRDVVPGANCQAPLPDLRGQVMATDNLTPLPDLVITQSPAPGTVLGLGPALVTFTVSDAAGNSATCQATVTIRSTPVFWNLVRMGSRLEMGECTGTLGLEPYFSDHVHDACDPNPTYQLVPPSGTVLPVGRTHVLCTASNMFGGTSSTTFTYDVLTSRYTYSGEIWTRHDNGPECWGIASSADGTNLVAVANGGLILTSTNAGATWTTRQSEQGFQCAASSADGSKLVVGASPGQIYTSTDAGVTWTPRESNRWWRSVASSADGTRLVAVASYGGQIYTSADAGTNWTARESDRYWTCAASSADGTKLVAAVNSGQIYTSTDAGVTWTPRDSNRWWCSVASSADGTKLVAAVSYGQIYTSTDSGVTWTPRGNYKPWDCIASSADGNKLVAGASGDIYVSADSGVTWTYRMNLGGGSDCVASSADGNNLVTSGYASTVHTSTTGGMIAADDPPTIVGATNRYVPAGPVVYSVTATNYCQPNVPVVCTPPSGSTFPLGMATVTCVATDALELTATASFQVYALGLATVSDVGCSLVRSNASTGSRGAELTSRVCPNARAAVAWFEYGLTPAYGGTTASNANSGNDLFAMSLSLGEIDGLVPGMTYHYRAVATNELGITRSPDQTFTVPSLFVPGDGNGDGIVDQGELNTVLSNYWPTCPWLYLTNTAGLGGTNVQFALTNATGWNFTVLMSTNLADWEALTNPAAPVWQFTDPAAPGQPQRYYRLRWP